jgi:hypothetical protein
VRLSSLKRKHQLTQELQEGQRQKLQWPLKNEWPSHRLRSRHMSGMLVWSMKIGNLWTSAHLRG